VAANAQQADAVRALFAELAQGQAEFDAKAMAWRSEAADDHSRVLAQGFAGAGAAGFTAQDEDKIW